MEMGSREIQVTVYECDNPECKDQKTLPEGEVYPGLEGSVDIPKHKSYDERAWTACSEACLTPAILAIRDSGRQKPAAGPMSKERKG